ncbi:hypothetical protein KR222_008447, partial [Zaprionus bogoriensis]
SRRDYYGRRPSYFGIGFLLFWILLFFAIVLPLFYRLPTALNVEDENNGEFLGERAYLTLNKLVNIGVRLAGSETNDLDAVSFLLKEIDDIKQVLLEHYFILEVDVQTTTGSYAYSNLLEWYHEVKNVVVKLSSKNSSSDSYLLINSHFDTVPTSPGASDDGFMVATMLEILRVMATTTQQFQHPVVFLFNGDEEMGMQASHGFITQHKWAPNCKAVINLEGAGGGGREILFQTGPSHPWLVEYYKKTAKHPFATTLAEEIFQAGLIPSDTDYRIFVQYGNIPGLDIVQSINGYVLHTKYDQIDVIPRGALQNTGDNVLGLVRALSNATELYNVQVTKGQTIFFDYLGIFFVCYSKETGTIINHSISGSVIIAILISISRMSAISSYSICHVMLRLIILVIVETIALFLGIALPLLIAYYFDSLGLSLTYFNSPWLMLGLYVCPSLFGLSLPIIIYLQCQQQSKLPFMYNVQLGLHGWALVLSILIIGLTSLGIRSVYIITFPLTFYAVALIVNLLTMFHDRRYSWAAVVATFQVIPFLYSCYVIYFFIVAMIPIQGRSGSASNPDTMISALTALGTILSFGFLIPLINTFRRPYTVVFSLVMVYAITMHLASSTQIGFPYRHKTASERVMYQVIRELINQTTSPNFLSISQHVRKILYDYDGTVSKDESGYLFNFQDRREYKPYVGVNLTGSWRTKSDCDKHMMCGVPLYDERWVNNRLQGMWVPRATVIPPSPTTLKLISKTVLENNTTSRFIFNLSGPHHISLFLQPYRDDFVSISNWSFSQSYLKSPPAFPLAYHIYMTFGASNASVQQNFFVDVSKPNGDFNVPLFQLGVSGHYIQEKGDALSQQFASSFPSYAALIEWPSIYQRYIF